MSRKGCLTAVLVAIAVLLSCPQLVLAGDHSCHRAVNTSTAHDRSKAKESAEEGLQKIAKKRDAKVKHMNTECKQYEGKFICVASGELCTKK